MIMRLILGLSFIVLALWVGFIGPDFFYPKPGSISKTSPGSSNKLKQEDVDKIVDKHLKNTSLAIELQKGAAEVQLRSQAPKPGQNVFWDKGDSVEYAKPLDSSDQSQLRIEQTFVKPSPGSRGLPADIVLSEMSENERQAYFDQLDREKYILDFRRNAWNGGYDVKVDETGEVTSVRPLPPHVKGRPFPDDQE